MRTLFFLLLAVNLTMGEALITDTLVKPEAGIALLLTSGKAELTYNDDGATLLIKKGKVWTKSENERLQLVFPAGIAQVNGTACFKSFDDLLHFQVFDGYVRFISTGGVPGETISAGYERIVSRKSEEQPRSLFQPNHWTAFCENQPDYGFTFGCPGGEGPENISIVKEPDTNMIIIIHPIQSGAELKKRLNKIAPHKELAERLKIELSSANTMIDTSINYPLSLRLSRQNKPYIIVDMTADYKLNKKDEILIKASLFDGVSKIRYTQEITAELEPTFSPDSDKGAEEINHSFYDILENFIIKKAGIQVPVSKMR